VRVCSTGLCGRRRISRRSTSAPETRDARDADPGLYAEIPYEQMTRERQEGYRSLIETRGALGGPNKIRAHNPKLAKVMGSRSEAGGTAGP